MCIESREKSSQGGIYPYDMLIEDLRHVVVGSVSSPDTTDAYVAAEEVVNE